MKKLIERVLIKFAKYLNIDLLAHAHVQIGVGHNTYSAGEEHVIEVILEKALSKPASVIFDVGANIGDYAKMLRQQFPGAEIFCFEPIPRNFEQLKLNTAALNISYHNIALGSSPGYIQLYKGANDADGAMATAYKDTLTNLFTFTGAPEQIINSEMSTIDVFCEDKIAVIDFLKIDVEGHELEVLKGATSMINGNRIKIIQFEFNEFNMFSKSFLFDFYKVLPGYDFYRILPKNKLLPLLEYSPVNEIFRYQNILAVNKSLKYKYAG